MLALVSVLLSQTPAWAVFGIGAHGGMDVVTIEEQTLTTFSLIDGSLVSLTREEISNPYHFDVQELDFCRSHFIGDYDPAVDQMVGVVTALNPDCSWSEGNLTLVRR